jgi:hypothetical protein
LPITFRKYYEGDSEMEALSSESDLIENHSKAYATPIINRRVGGKVVSEDTSLKVFNMTVPEDGYEMWKHKWKLKLHERKLRKLHLFGLADKFAEKYKELKVLTTGKVNATLAVQRATRLALKRGYTDIADSLSISRAASMTLEEHREHATLALETIRMRELVAQPVPEDPRAVQDYMEKLKYNEDRYTNLGMTPLAHAVSKHLLAIRKTCLVRGVKCLKTNASIISDLQTQPDLALLPYAELAKKFGITVANMVRLVRLAGVEKQNAKSIAKDKSKAEFIADPLVATDWAAAGVKHGLSRMTAYRYAKESDLITDRRKKPVIPTKQGPVQATPMPPAAPSVEAEVDCDGLEDEESENEKFDQMLEECPTLKQFEVYDFGGAAPEEPSHVPKQRQKLAPPPKPVTVPGKCHQRVIRENTREEDIAKLTPVLGDLSALKASMFDLAYERYTKEHRGFIRRYEWLGNPGVSIKWCFTARYKGELGGVVLLSEPYNPSATQALIARGACAGWTPKNVGSMLVMFACRQMAANTVKRSFVAYADEEANEVGQIYQACNFKFLGWKEASYLENENGERKSAQTFKRTSRMVPWLKKQGITLAPECFTAKGYLHWSAIPADIKASMRAHIASEKAKCTTKTRPRGKYLLLLGPNKQITKQMNEAFKDETFPYPRRVGYEAKATGNEVELARLSSERTALDAGTL